MSWQSRIRAHCLERVQIETANELPSPTYSGLFICILGVKCCPEWYFDGGGAKMGLFFNFFNELLNELIFVFNFPTVLVGIIVIIVILGLDAASVYFFVLLE